MNTFVNTLTDEWKDADGNTLLIHASRVGDCNAIEALIKNGADTNKTNEDGYTALIVASENGDPEAVKLLINAGADVNNATDRGTTALMFASQNNHGEIVKLLINAGAVVNKTALMFASQQGHDEIVKLLINAGANVDEQDDSGNTALTLAIQHNHRRIVTLLLNVGANPMIPDMRPSILANGTEYEDIVKEAIEELYRHYMIEKAMYIRNIKDPIVKLRMPVITIEQNRRDVESVENVLQEMLAMNEDTFNVLCTMVLPKWGRMNVI